MAIIYGGKATFFAETLYKWETHGERDCKRCAALAGEVKSLDEWGGSVMPGFHHNCDCSLSPITNTATIYSPIIFAKIPDYLLGLIRFSNLAYFILPQVWPADLSKYMEVCFAPKWDALIRQAQAEWDPKTMSYEKRVIYQGGMVSWVDGTMSPLRYVVPGPVMPTFDDEAPYPTLVPLSKSGAGAKKVQVYDDGPSAYVEPKKNKIHNDNWRYDIGH